MALDRRWLFSSNPFIVAARDSDENAMKQIFFHDAALKSWKDAYSTDTDYSAWYTRFHTLRDAAELKYNAYDNIEAAQEGLTVNVNDRLKAIKGKRGKARDWYNRIAAIYAISNPARFKAIYSDGLKPFYKNGKDNIIAALRTLSLNIGADDNELMVAIKDEVDAEYNIIKPGRSTQKSAIVTTGITRGALDEAITAALEMQFGDLGLEINKFRSDPEKERKIKSFHDLEVIQARQQKTFNLTLHNPETRDIATRTMVFNSKLRVKAVGGDVKMFLASTPGGSDSTPVIILDGQNHKFTAADFHVVDYGVNRHLTVVTTSGEDISFTLQLY